MINKFFSTYFGDQNGDSLECYGPIHYLFIHKFFIYFPSFQNNNSRTMHVSKNGGDSWDPVQVPTVTPERVLSQIIETFVLFIKL